MASYNSIKVVARFRPQNKVEVANGGEPIVSFESEETCSIKSKEASGPFTFDRVFGMGSRQIEVFEFSIRSTVDDILKGYNGTVFAYGQTGAGKSYTMMGADIDDGEQKGIIPRIVEQIFASILASPGNIEYTVKVGYLEIYMERIRDLLRPENDNLPIHEEKSRGVYVKDLTELYVSSVDEVYEVMRRGGLARAVAATNMNQESSRSHSIFVVTITQKNVETGSQKSGQLFLVDLAGSEKVGKTGASGQTLEEAKKINKSLSALGMVINSLTDGKSTHIPYRDSKLTRILQESLGGNSRTTLIINCSPSSYNDAETISTLRFGTRAKSIKNKARVNAELSSTELKILLKKEQSKITTYEQYISSLEGEVSLWRDGQTVPQESWIKSIATDRISTHKPTSSVSEATTIAPGTPSRGPKADLRAQSRASGETPSRPDSRQELLDRSSTPSLPIDKDERDEFLRRENELQDQVTEKESALAHAEKTLADIKEELAFLKEHDTRATKENERLNTESNELRMQLEKMSFEAKEDRISMDGLKEANAELTSELDEVKTHLLEARMEAKESGGGIISVGGAVTGDDKERVKRERMKAMMAGFDLNGPDDADARSRVDALEEKLRLLQKEHEAVLESKLDASDIQSIRTKLGTAYVTRSTEEDNTTAQLKAELENHREGLRRAHEEKEELLHRVEQSNANDGDASNHPVSRQIAEFDAMKKSLMRDLQNRCERVVELEISLDETREQYNNVLRTSNNRAQQKKMAFLERNLEQLTVVQKQLIEQNGSLKKEVAIAERKLIARNERILALEQMLAESQEKLVHSNSRFEVQLAAVKERLEAAKAGSTRGLATNNGVGGASFAGLVGSRIAKPLRGGGAAENPAIAGLQQQDSGAKRASWFFNSRPA